MADTDTATAVANAVSEANKAAAAAQAAALAKAADEHKAAAAMVNKASGEALKAREEELAALEAELLKLGPRQQTRKAEGGGRAARNDEPVLPTHGEPDLRARECSGAADPQDCPVQE